MKKMKKDLLFVSPMVIITIVLFMLKLTRLPAHIVLSVLGVAILIAYTIIMKKEWKLPKIEIFTRAMYGIAFITGVIVMNVEGILVISIIHKISAALFVFAFIGLFIYKLIKVK